MDRPDHSILEQAGLASGLLSQAEIDRAWHALSESLRRGERSLFDLSDELLAEQLITMGALNRWQAEQLSRGRTKFTLGPYRIIDAIGHGGMGYVFKGEHQLLGRIEAIKVLPKTQLTPASIAAFCREIRSQALLDHPNLVRLSFADRDGDTYFLVTEYVPGADLRRLIRHHGPLTAVQAAVIISQAAEALAYAHSRGLVHRDVKPGNLLVTPDGHTKLTDLGLASFSSDAGPAAEGPRHIVGTPDFVAPETIRDPQEVRRSSDIYSLGCTLYYAVTGKVPFPGGTTAEKLKRQLNETPLEPTRLNPHVDANLALVIDQMMRKTAETRIASAAEVIARLKPWTAQADATTWRQIGQFAAQPGEPTYNGPLVADTAPMLAEELEGDGQFDGLPPLFVTPPTPRQIPPAGSGGAEAKSPASGQATRETPHVGSRLTPSSTASGAEAWRFTPRRASSDTVHVSPAELPPPPAAKSRVPLVLWGLALATAVVAAALAIAL